MNILLIGSGGREHALAWKLSQSPQCDALYCAPGNAGIEAVARCVDIGVNEIDKLVQFAKENLIDFVIVGPEDPLVNGVTDAFKVQNIPIFGPNAKAAQLEGSKGFMKDLCAKYDIPTAKYGRFTSLDKACSFIDKIGAPLVVKTDGLAAGKGVIICENTQQAKDAATDMLSGASFGAAGEEVIIEEFLEGEELSYFALLDGEDILALTSAQDHKRVGDGDTGLNTGGMGAYSPAHFINDELEVQIIENIIKPTARGMVAEGCSFTGVLFAGVMVHNGEAKLLEHNIRFGDPECQTLMMRLQGDLVEILYAAAQGKLHEINGEQVKWSENTALCVVMASEGYPGSYKKNTVIKGVENVTESVVFHAGTTKNEASELISIGGRVLGVTALDKTMRGAQQKAYASVDQIEWDEGFCRRDIGWRAVKSQDEAA